MNLDFLDELITILETPQPNGSSIQKFFVGKPDGNAVKKLCNLQITIQNHIKTRNIEGRPRRDKVWS